MNDHANILYFLKKIDRYQFLEFKWISQSVSEIYIIVYSHPSDFAVRLSQTNGGCIIVVPTVCSRITNIIITICWIGCWIYLWIMGVMWFVMEQHPILSHPVPSHPISSHPIPSYPIPSHPIPSTHTVT